VDAAQLSFPLVPRWRQVGSAFVWVRATRHGLGSGVTATRLRSDGELVVREDHAGETPRAIVVADRRPSMSLFPGELPWLSKPAALRTIWEAVVIAAIKELGFAGYLDTASGHGWFPPHSASAHAEIEERQRSAGFDGATGGLDGAFERLAEGHRSLPPGSFVFVCSDFFDPPSAAAWLRGLGHCWDLVPVIVQDPFWEQSFPLVNGLVVPLADPDTGKVVRVRLTRAEAQARREANEARLEALLDDFARLGLDHVVVDDSTPSAVLEAFTRWSEARLALGGRML